MTTPDTAGLLVTRITLERRISPQGRDEYSAEFCDANGDTPGLVETLGMLELAKDTAIRFSMLDSDCDCEDDE